MASSNIRGCYYATSHEPRATSRLDTGVCTIVRVFTYTGTYFYTTIPVIYHDTLSMVYFSNHTHYLLFALSLSINVLIISSNIIPIGMFALSPFRRAIPSVLSITAATPTSLTPVQSLAFLSQQQRSRSSRSRRGLYDGKDVRFGNNVPFSMKKTRRRWNPNVQFKRLYSEVLDEMIKFHVTAAALRSIDKFGGLDNYLLYSPNVSTKG